MIIGMPDNYHVGNYEVVARVARCCDHCVFLNVVAFGHSKLSWPGNLLISSPGLSINKLSCKINYIIYKTVKDLATATKWRRLQYLLSPAALTYLPLIRSLPQICPAC